jgi:hypothetical protein
MKSSTAGEGRLIVQGGLYNGLQRSLGLMGLGDQFGARRCRRWS